MPYAPPATADALRALIRFYRTGEAADREAYDIAWVRDQDSPVDTINGFVEVYLDARGMKGAWESLVFYVNHEKTDAIRTLARHAQWFEDHMPWDPQYRKPGVTGVTRQRDRRGRREPAIPGPVTPIGINLPNDERIRDRARQQVGLARQRDGGVRTVDAARRTGPSSRGRARKPSARRAWSGAAAELTTNMHEVIGHASGQADPALGDQRLRRRCASTTRRSRRRAPIWWRCTSCRTRSSPNSGSCRPSTRPRSSCAEYEAYARNALVQLRRVREGIAHRRRPHAQPPAHRALADGEHARRAGAVARRQDVLRRRRRPRRSTTAWPAAGRGAADQEPGRLRRRAARWSTTYGVHFDAGAARRDRRARAARSTCRPTRGSSCPALEPVHGADGRIADVRIDLSARPHAPDAGVRRRQAPR